MKRAFAYVVATFFGVGYFPVASGTAASAATLPLAFLLVRAPAPVAWGVLAAIVIVGSWAAHVVSRDRGIVDPAIVVVDEVAGQILALILFTPTAVTFVAAFVLFRVFDIVKPWPASWFDRRVKNGFGIVADDLVAGGYAAAVLALGRHFAPAAFG